MTEPEFRDASNLVKLQQARALIREVVHGEEDPALSETEATRILEMIASLRYIERGLEARLKVRAARSKKQNEPMELFRREGL